MSSVSIEKWLTDVEKSVETGKFALWRWKMGKFVSNIFLKNSPPHFYVFFSMQLFNFVILCCLPFQMSNLENHNPQVIRQITKEVKTLSTETLEGIKMYVN